MRGINFDDFTHLQSEQDHEDNFDQTSLLSSKVGIADDFSELEFFIDEKVSEDLIITKEGLGLSTL